MIQNCNVLWINLAVMLVKYVWHIFENLRKFRNIGKLPIRLVLPENVTSDNLRSNKARWHHACHQKFTNLQLDRLKTRLSKRDVSKRKSKRQHLQHSKSYCLFCNEDGNLIHFSLKIVSNDYVQWCHSWTTLICFVKYQIMT